MTAILRKVEMLEFAEKIERVSANQYLVRYTMDKGSHTVRYKKSLIGFSVMCLVSVVYQDREVRVHEYTADSDDHAFWDTLNNKYYDLIDADRDRAVAYANNFCNYAQRLVENN